MFKKRTIGFIMAMALVFSACGGAKKADNDAEKKNEKEVVETAKDTEESKEGKEGKRVIKVSTKFVDDEQTAKSLVKVCKNINERSKGSLELQLFTGGILPIGKDGMEQVVSGSDWILVDGVNFLGDYVPDYNAITGPFLYKTFDEYFHIVKSDIGQELNKKAEELGIKVLSMDWVFGFRNMECKKAIKTPEDMKGLNIRVPTSQLYTYTLEAMGANPVSMPYPDTYAALQQGVIDGVEGSILSYYGTGQYENVKEYSLTKHLLGVSAVSISTKVWNDLTDEQRTIIQEEFDKGAKENLEETNKLEKEYTEKLKEKGVTFHEADIPKFQEATKSVYTKFDKWTPGIYERILEELKNVK
ncbi:C4-dicarboxylate TRAP transporter substrate-binding protein [uncultured Anaerococcus sp.]|uniref:C4-dicarboxylate TRAP transporter substrate-binding protein n=1 Tax=uncultured Anaerococcus sp. TaxID=293428 RepID=UPI00288C3F22|nr:C4-dicarboxylate TRAP transporter substrate-binding protein [uncultured Anaerococcus sp.]